MNSPTGSRKRRKFAGQTCYFCGDDSPGENEDIPGKQFGVTAQTGGLVIPVCRSCNGAWSTDQEFVRLRITLHAGSRPGAGYIKSRELIRVKGGKEKPPQLGRCLKERAKQFFVNGKEFMGLTDTDFARFSNVLRHWAAGIHYLKRNSPAAVPGSVHFILLQPKFFRKVQLSLQPHGVWKAKDGGEFGRWWFFPGPATSESITIVNLLRSDELRFAVRFPAVGEGMSTERARWPSNRALQPTSGASGGSCEFERFPGSARG